MSLTEKVFIFLAWLIALCYIIVFISWMHAVLFTAIFLLIVCIVILVRHFRKY